MSYQQLLSDLYLVPKFGKNPHQISKNIHEKLTELMNAPDDARHKFSNEHSIDCEDMEHAFELYKKEKFPMWNTFYTWCRT